MARWYVYVRRSWKEASAADVSDEQQEASARALIPAGATVVVISDSGGHNSGRTESRDGYQELIAAVRAGKVDGIAVYDLSRLARNARLMLNLRDELERVEVADHVARVEPIGGEDDLHRAAVSVRKPTRARVLAQDVAALDREAFGDAERHGDIFDFGILIFDCGRRRTDG